MFSVNTFKTHILEYFPVLLKISIWMHMAYGKMWGMGPLARSESSLDFLKLIQFVGCQWSTSILQIIKI